MARPSKPGNHERGWNDPPMFLHTPSLTGETTSTTPAKKTLLNKRVAHPSFPSTSSDASKGSPLPQLLPPAGNNPPPGAGNVILFPPSSTSTALPAAAPIIVPHMAPPLSPTGEPPAEAAPEKDAIEVPDFADDNQMFLYVVTHLKRVLGECRPHLSDRIVEEVERKLNVFENMWESGKISYPVKAAMARLSIALCRRNCDVAQEVHMGLMMDYVSEVAQWMVGVKRLIHEAKQVPPTGNPESPTKEKTSPLSAHIQAESSASDGNKDTAEQNSPLSETSMTQNLAGEERLASSGQGS